MFAESIQNLLNPFLLPVLATTWSSTNIPFPWHQ